MQSGLRIPLSFHQPSSACSCAPLWWQVAACSGARQEVGKSEGRKACVVSHIHVNPTRQLALTSHFTPQSHVHHRSIYRESGKQTFSEYNVITIKLDSYCWYGWYRRGKWTLGRYLVFLDKVNKNGFAAKMPPSTHIITFNPQNKSKQNKPSSSHNLKPYF